MIHSFDKDIAVQFGLPEAILLNHMLYWIEQNEANRINFNDGYYWTYNTSKAYSEIFPYLSQRQVQCALKHLRDEGILIAGNYNKSAYDRTLWYAFTEKGKSIMQKCKMEDAKMLNGFDPQVKPIPYNNTYNNTVNNTYNKKKNIKESNPTNLDGLISDYTSNAELVTAIQDYIKMRKAIHSPLTDRGLKICLNKLDKFANTDALKIALLEQSIERGWKGIFPLKDETQLKKNDESVNPEWEKYHIICEAEE